MCPLSISARMITDTPPRSCTSLARYFPPGRRSPISGVRANTSATSSTVKRMPASLAIAGMCSAALVEPPVAATMALAFSSARRVTRSRGSGPPRFKISITISPARFAIARRSA